jgi:hypothetical protein
LILHMKAKLMSNGSQRKKGPHSSAKVVTDQAYIVGKFPIKTPRLSREAAQRGDVGNGR